LEKKIAYGSMTKEYKLEKEDEDNVEKRNEIEGRKKMSG
jgi:hypothetical protein